MPSIACAALADPIVRGCPRVSILASSREPLGITGEIAFRLASLSLPDRPHAVTTVGSVASTCTAGRPTPDRPLDTWSGLPVNT
jgi:predicted ATPase